MVFNQLKLNAELLYYGKKYTVLSIDPPELSIVSSEGDGRVQTLNFVDLVNNPSFKPGKQMIKLLEQDESKYRAVLESLSDKNRDEVSRRFEMIRPVLVWERAKQADVRQVHEFMSRYSEYLEGKQSLYELTQLELFERISKKFSVPDEFGIMPRGCSVRSIKRYLSAYRKAEAELSKRGEEGLVARKGSGHQYRKDNKVIEICHPKKPDIVLDHLSVRIDEKYIPIIKEAIEHDYLTLKRKTKKSVYDSIVVRCLRNNLEPPKEITIIKILGRIDPQVGTRARDGNKAAESYDPVSRGFSNEEAQYPLHLVEIDHTELDLDVIDERTGYVIGRPWITLGIDVYSRMVWCMYVSFEPPSANVVRKAIEQGVFLKRAKERYGTFSEWDVFGIPNTIYLDNGPEFRNAAVKRMITETLKSNVRYRPVKTPRYGGTIERLFGTLNKQLIHQLDGTRKSSPTDLGEYDPDKEAALTLEDVRALITMYITDVYHMEIHRGLPLNSNTPAVRYLEGLQMAGFPDFITEDKKEAYQIELLPVVMKPYTRDGIRLNNVLYKSDSLSRLISTRAKKYKVKYDIDDISKIYLQPPDTDEFVPVPAVQPAAEELHIMNWYTWKQLREIMKSESEDKRARVPGTKNVAQAKVKLQEFYEKNYKKRRRVRQAVARTDAQVSIDVVRESASTSKKHQTSVQDLIASAKRKAQERKNEGGYGK